MLAVLAFASSAVAAPVCPEAGFAVVERAAAADTRPVKSIDGKTVFVRRQAITTTADITEIMLAGDDFEAAMQLKLKPGAAKKLNEATTNNSGVRIAFVADDSAVMLVTWEGPYGMNAELGMQLSMRNGMKRAQPLVAAIQQCIEDRPK
jgi:preprotein translocase subunit SecD